MPEPELDETDRRLLRLVQRNARASTREIAEAAGMSASPAWRRLRRLQAEGVVARHVALLDRERLGLRAMAYVVVTLTEHTAGTLERFEAFVRVEDRILECARVSGTGDYLLKVVARDVEDLDRFLIQRLLATGVVRATTTSIVLRQTKATTELPV